jgi:hypothetical protein
MLFACEVRAWWLEKVTVTRKWRSRGDLRYWAPFTGIDLQKPKNYLRILLEDWIFFKHYSIHRRSMSHEIFCNKYYAKVACRLNRSPSRSWYDTELFQISWICPCIEIAWSHHGFRVAAPNSMWRQLSSCF